MKTMLRQVWFNPLFALTIVLILSGVYVIRISPWMSTWGLSLEEAHMSLPGDGVVEGTQVTSTRGVTIHAPAGEVWKWVVQLGQDRAGFYSHDWLENLTMADIHNQREIRPEWQSHQAGEKVLGAGGMLYGQSSGWNIAAYEEGRLTYLWGSIVLIPLDSQNTRLIARTFAEPLPPVSQMINLFTYDWMHFVMERGMLLGIKERAESAAPEFLVEFFSSVGWILAGVLLSLLFLFRRRGWVWGALPALYAVLILTITGDGWSALAGYLWWGVIAAGFLVWGRAWWSGLALSTALVVLVLVTIAPSHSVFGLAFLLISLGTIWIVSRYWLRQVGRSQTTI